MVPFVPAPTWAFIRSLYCRSSAGACRGAHCSRFVHRRGSRSLTASRSFPSRGRAAFGLPRDRGGTCREQNGYACGQRHHAAGAGRRPRADRLRLGQHQLEQCWRKPEHRELRDRQHQCIRVDRAEERDGHLGHQLPAGLLRLDNQLPGGGLRGGHPGVQPGLYGLRRLRLGTEGARRTERGQQALRRLARRSTCRWWRARSRCPTTCRESPTWYSPRRTWPTSSRARSPIGTR